jgi:hypothetical protein
MSYSSEIRNIMRQAYHLGVEIEAYRKDNDFAALNGWRRSRSRFSVKTLLRAGVHDGYGQSA